jgi:23S rRNA (adenine2503-C2)-methyltransferase
LLKGLIFKLNLIPCNPVPELGYEAPTGKEIKDFRNYLTELGIHHTLRKERGQDIAAACGQLRRTI